MGGDNESGDIVVTVADPSVCLDHFTVVIEARDERTPRGRKQISDDMADGLSTRSGHFGLYVSKTPAGLAKEIGDWSEGSCAHGPYVACTAGNLVNGLRWAVIWARIQALLAHRPEADVSAIQAEVNRIRTALRRGKTAKTRISEIHKLADGACGEVDSLQQEIAEALVNIERALRAGPGAAA